MIRTPKSWREAEGLNLADMAARCGITGKNPAATYRRYENGEQQAPTEIVEKVRTLSGGAIGPEEWHAVRLEYLKEQRAPAGPLEARP